VRDDLMEALPNEVIAAAIRRLDTDDALYLIENLDEVDRREILGRLPELERDALARALDYPEGAAGRLMKTEFVAIPAFWSVGQTIDYMRETSELPDEFVEIYVIDPAFHLAGAVPLSRILRSRREIAVSNLMETDLTVFKVTDEQEEVAYKFAQYNLVSAPVTDAEGRLVGMLMIDDIVEVMHEEAEEDMLRLGGVGDEEITDTVWSTARSRFTWLSLNLATAVLASWVISWFDASIDQMVALAILMPIVASMGGNAGTQTMTVAVRALATRDLGPVNAMRVVARESAVGLLNGLLFALLMGMFAWWWFGLGGLGLVIGAAMVINLVAAALAGILVPLALDALEVDPAVASGVFVTTVTDVMGFFAFLGLASLWLL
jgi:magnesium transporter